MNTLKFTSNRFVQMSLLLVIGFIGTSLNSYAQDSTGERIDRIELLNNMPAQIRCSQQQSFVSEGAWARRANVSARQAVVELELEAKEQVENYQEANQKELDYRLMYTQAGWDAADDYVAAEIIRLDDLETDPEWKGKIADVMIPPSVLDDISDDYFTACMEYEKAKQPKTFKDPTNFDHTTNGTFIKVQNQDLQSMKNFSGLQRRMLYCADRKDTFKINCFKRKAQERADAYKQANQAAIREQFGDKTISDLTDEEFQAMLLARQSGDSDFDIEAEMMKENASCEVEAWEGKGGVFECVDLYPKHFHLTEDQKLDMFDLETPTDPDDAVKY